jgi:hypothetical protein
VAGIEEDFDWGKSSVIRARLEALLHPDEVALLYLRFGAERSQASLAQERNVHRGVISRLLKQLLARLRSDPILQGLGNGARRATTRPSDEGTREGDCYGGARADLE